VGDALIAVRALEGDLNKDCVINVIDDQMIASHYRPRSACCSTAPGST